MTLVHCLAISKLFLIAKTPGFEWSVQILSLNGGCIAIKYTPKSAYDSFKSSQPTIPMLHLSASGLKFKETGRDPSTFFLPSWKNIYFTFSNKKPFQYLFFSTFLKFFLYVAKKNACA